jgi:MSHA biogenesis protein MshJ
MNALAPWIARFDRLSLRERALVAAATLGVLIALWDTLLMQPLQVTRGALTQELASAGDPDRNATMDDPHRAALVRVAELQAGLQSADTQLTSSSAGFVPAARMADVLRDVVDRQQGITLVSLRKLPVKSLVEPTPVETTGEETAARSKSGTAAATNGAPYVHPIELVIDGSYGDVLAYIRSLEALPWRLRWTVLELKTLQYPVNRVRIELSTLGMEPTWLGVEP